jgi:acyl transferase domain-containing protein
MAKAMADGFDTFLEISPHTVLCHAMLACAKHSGIAITAVPSTRRNADERTVMLSAIAALHVHGPHGRALDWGALCDGKASFLQLPHNPWQRERYQLAASSGRGDHPMLGRHIEIHDTGHHVWESSLDVRTLPMLADHRVANTAVLSGTSYVEIVLAAARTACRERWPVLHDIVFEHAQVLPADAGQAVQVSTSETAEGAVVRLHARRDTGDGPSWTRLVTARATRAGHGATPESASASASASAPESVTTIRARCYEPVDPAAHYANLAAGAVFYGPRFQGVRQLIRCDGEALALVGWPMALAEDREPFLLHPALLDACWQTAVAAAPGTSTATGVYVPIGIRRLRVHADGPVAFDAGPFQCHAQVTPDGPSGPSGTSGTLSATLVVRRSDGSVLVEIDALRLRPIAGALFEDDARPADRHPNGAVEGTLGADDPRGTGVRHVLAALAADAEGERLPRIEALLTQHLAQVLGRPTARIKIDTSLHDIGLDSLMALELRNRIRADLDIAPSLARLVMSDVSLRGLARDLLEQLAAKPEPRRDLDASTSAMAASALGTDDLSEEQILALLQELDSPG